MKLINACVLVTVMLLAWPAAMAGKAQADTQPATDKASATVPATTEASSKEASTQQAKASQEDEALLPKALINAAKASFVIVEVYFKKDLTDPAAAESSDQSGWEISRMYRNYIDQKRPQERVGVVLDDKGHILIVDDALEDRFLDKTIVRDVTGASIPARRARLLSDAPGVLLKVDEASAGKLRPLKFSELADADVDTSLLQASMYKNDDQWRIQASPLRPQVRYHPGESANVYYGRRVRGYSRYGSGPGIIATQDGLPVGCALASFMDLKQAECTWKGPDLLKAKGIEWEQLTELREKCRKELIAAVQEIVIKPHERAREEFSTYGLAISPTEILVPQSVNSSLAAQIGKIYVKFSPTSRQRVDFVGAYKDFGAFVVKLRKGKLPAHFKQADQDLPLMRPFWVARPRKRFGKKYVDLRRNRIEGKERGYGGEYHWQAARDIPSGSYLVDLQGRLAGIYTRQRIENEEARQLEQARGNYRYQSSRSRESYSQYPRHDSQSNYRIFTISEIRDDLSAPSAHMDPKIKVKTRSQAKRRAWFGVEYVPISSGLAEQFKIEKATKDGKLGFVVNAVYPGSPAEKLGINVGDVLLKIDAPGVPYPIRLASSLVREDRYGSYYRYGGDTGPVAPTWKSRRNFMTVAMDRIGIGKKIKITYHRHLGVKEAKTSTAEYTIAQGPVDFDSAPKWRNRKLGLTAKDVTYEIRYALNLKASDGGVIVAKVEPGSPALIARIFPNEIITSLDEKPIRSARQMRDLIAAARKAGGEKVRLTVLRLGKTRFADLKISAYDPADDEELEEDQETISGDSP